MELPPYYVPDAFREWGQKLFDWQANHDTHMSLPVSNSPIVSRCPDVLLMDCNTLIALAANATSRTLV